MLKGWQQQHTGRICHLEPAEVSATGEMQQREPPETCILTAAQPDQSLQPTLASLTVEPWMKPSANGGQVCSMQIHLCLQLSVLSMRRGQGEA